MPSGQITCLLSGTFNNSYDLDRTRLILDAIRKSVNLKVIWARAGESRSDSLDLGEDLIVSATHSEMPRIISETHFGIAIFKPENQVSSAAAVPTKIGEFWASGRPVIVSEGIGDLDQMISNTQTGVIVENNSTLQGVTCEIIKLVNDANTPARCRELALKYFDMGNSIHRYSEIYNRMLKSSSTVEVD